MPFKVLSANASLTTTLSPIADFDIAFGANQIGQIELALRVDLPANHGGLLVNWRVPTMTWPFYGTDEAWSMRDLSDASSLIILGDINPADPQHSDVIAVGPAALVRTVTIRAIHNFKAPAGGGTLRLYAAMVASAASPTVLVTDSARKLASKAWYELQ